MKTLTFDTLYEKAEKERKKDESEKLFGSTMLHRLYMKKLKKYMMKSKIRKLKNKISENEKLFIKSLTEPNIDSVEIKMRIIKMNDELNTSKP